MRGQAQVFSSGRSICCFPESSLVVQEPCLLHSHRHHANVTAPCTVRGFNLLISNIRLLFLGVSMNDQKLARIFLNRSSQSLGQTPRFLGECPGIRPPDFEVFRASVVSSTTEAPAPAPRQMSHRLAVSPAVSSCRLCFGRCNRQQRVVMNACHDRWRVSVDDYLSKRIVGVDRLFHVDGEFIQQFDHGRDSERMHPVLGFLQTEQSPAPGIGFHDGKGEKP